MAHSSMYITAEAVIKIIFSKLDTIAALGVLLDNIFVFYGDSVYHQVIGI